MTVEALAEKVIDGRVLSKEEALWLYGAPLDELSKYADKVRTHFCHDAFDLCTIVNGKSGRCSEDCRFCAQSSHYHTNLKAYQMLSEEALMKDAKKVKAQGIYRYSIVTAGKALSDDEVAYMCRVIERIKKEYGLLVCTSFGLLSKTQYEKLKKSGVDRVHNNLETSEAFFSSVCTTHSFQEKVKAILAAKEVGLEVCSGGIVGLGESIEDRIDMAFSLRDLGIKNVPVNMLNPIAGTPMADRKRLSREDMQRIIAIYRFILPDAFIRLAGGRGLLDDKGKSCFLSGANAAISGDMLTTAGISTENDLALLDELAYTLVKA